MPFDYSVGMSLIPIRIAVVCGQFLCLQINTVFLVMVLYKIFKNRAGRRQKVNEGIKVDVVT